MAHIATNTNNPHNNTTNQNFNNIAIQNHNVILANNLLDQTRFFEAFNTYKVVALELISIFCNIKKNKIKYQTSKNTIGHDNDSMDSDATLKDSNISVAQEITFLNLILKAIKPLNDPIIRPWSVIGRYVRRCIITYEKMSFDKIVTLCNDVSNNLKIIQTFNLPPPPLSIMDLNEFPKVVVTDDQSINEMDLDASIVSVEETIGSAKKSKTLNNEPKSILFNKHLVKFQHDKHITSSTNKLSKTTKLLNNLNMSNIAPIASKNENTLKKLKFTSSTNAGAFSRKIAEYFVAQQAYLLENNEYDSLNPIQLQDKLEELLGYDSSFADAYYLKYLNQMRIKDYTGASKALHDYFDRLVLSGSISLAALNMVSLEYRFGNKENAVYALKEAITSAHSDSDNACLQHCLSWLYKISTNDDKRKDFLIKNSCSRAITYELYDLVSYNLHYFARENIGVYKPSLIFDLLNKIDIVNLKMNCRTELALLSQCQKSTIWNYYGIKKMSLLYVQLLLNLLPKSGSYKLNTESQCIALCYLVTDFAKKGLYQASLTTLEFCKLYFNIHSKTSQHWIYTENMILLEKHFLSGEWNDTRIFIERLSSIDRNQALLQEMSMLIFEGNIDRAKEIGNKLNELSQNINQDLTTHQIFIDLKFNQIRIFISLNENSNALITAIKLYNEIKELDLYYDLMSCSLLIAKILLQMDLPEQAVKYLEKTMIFTFSNGSLLDQAKLHFLYARCLHKLKKKDEMETIISHMNNCIQNLESIEAFIYLKSAYSYISLLHHENGDVHQRNKFASKYQAISQRLPLIQFTL